MANIITAKELKKLQDLIKFQKKKIKQLEFLAERDFLTGIYNRYYFINQTEKFLEQLKVFTHPNAKLKPRKSFFIKDLFIVFVDLDNIKIINDTFGHKAGDKVLKEVAVFFQKSLRKTDILARWGGDEFVITLLGTNKKQAFKMIEKLRKKLMKLEINFKNKKIKITASFGIVQALIEKNYKKKINLRLHHLINKANKAMYKAKKDHGKNVVVILD